MVGPPVAPPPRLLALPRHVLVRLRDPFTNLCVPLRSLHLGFVSGRFQVVLGLFQTRLRHGGVLLEGGLGSPSGRLEMVLGLSEMRVVVGPGCSAWSFLLSEGGVSLLCGSVRGSLSLSSAIFALTAALSCCWRPRISSLRASNPALR